MVALLAGLVERVEACDDLADAVVEMMSGATRAIAAQPVLAYMRAHEPATVRVFFSFERLDSLSSSSQPTSCRPALRRFLDPDEARMS